MSFDISKLQDPPMPSYSFSVYHIDVFEKSKFKDYDSVLTNRLAQDHARATYLASKFKYRDTETKKDPDFQEKYAHNTQARINFGCSIDQRSGSQDFSGTFSGIAGLGRRVSTKAIGGYSLPSQLGSSIFALCLPSSTSIVINDKVVPVDPSWWNNGNQGVIVDSGTLISRFPHDFYIIFRDVFRLEVKDYEMVEDGVGPFDTCYKDDPYGAEVYFPVVRFYFGNISPSQELMLVQERVVIQNAGFYCLGFFGWNHNFSIIGTNQLQGTGLTFDTKNNVLTFSVDACD
ncbi:PREDICTED: protein ASPARTIC PROTEASE IN GUARD CELL 2-like [Nicotiana attenuata]|uniref:protein ASPARTIC PROTEASE IN GUARD CELL 2-like n=1 Tax=Nicotiana attenuata TaxID=49451 RepID=UPI000905937B|nr:PREDICTED: protein ASPARTIC PROTEASE IN GUARD CELL 2-like [Nicotiana attenuata]